MRHQIGSDRVDPCSTACHDHAETLSSPPFDQGSLPRYRVTG